MDARIPAHLEVTAIRRIAEAQGGFATVLAKGDPDAGAIGVVIIGRDEPMTLFERIPQADGNRIFVRTLLQQTDNTNLFSDRIAKRRANDPDLWLIEADVPDRERFVAALPG
ncbi:DUF1491 family protein [Tsuneonella amylolytica]|uniref:DUF1491 family protein n=1 Tax=Tsuneonella amylolytica TaxID=2338327 RepID=UPI000EA932BB|nr:DUF1491 family protein [Tsuneonella amylolytica]